MSKAASPFSPTRRALLAAAGVAALPGPSRAQSGPPLEPLTPKPTTLRLTPERATPALSFSGEPAPLVLRRKVGDMLAFDLAAPADAPLALHWQGARIAAEADGAPPLGGPAASAGGHAAIRFAAREPGFHWARPSAQTGAGALLAKGLLAGLVIEEPSPPPVDQEAVVIVKDWRIDAEGRLVEQADDQFGAGRVGQIVTVNGALAPMALSARPNARLRLRLLNACNARLMVVSFAAARVAVIAIDGQPCDPFEPVRHMVPVGPGARFELMLDMPGTPGEAAVTLRGATPPGAPALADQALVAIKVEGAPLPARAPFEGLPLNPALPLGVRLQDARRAELVMEGGLSVPEALGQAMAMGYDAAAERKSAPKPTPWRLNGRSGQGPGDKPLLSVPRGAPLVLAFVNRTAFPQTTHVRGHVMRLLHPLDDGWEPYWRDAVITPAGKTSQVAFIADNPGRWLIENADPDRAAAGLSTWIHVM